MIIPDGNIVSESGFARIDRAIFDSPIILDPGLFHLFVLLALRANHATGFMPVESGKGMVLVEIHPGQTVVGRNKTAKEFGLKPEAYRSRLERLEKLELISVERTNQYSIVTIWKYLVIGGPATIETTNQSQQRQPTNTQIRNQPIANHFTNEIIDESGATSVATTNQYSNSEPTNHQLITNQTPLYKNEENEEKKKKRTRLVFKIPEEEEIKSYWLEKALYGDPDHFRDHYQANGWTQGKAGKKISDWRAAANNWSRRQKSDYGATETWASIIDRAAKEKAAQEEKDREQNEERKRLFERIVLPIYLDYHPGNRDLPADERLKLAAKWRGKLDYFEWQTIQRQYREKMLDEKKKEQAKQLTEKSELQSKIEREEEADFQRRKEENVRAIEELLREESESKLMSPVDEKDVSEIPFSGQKS